MNASCSKARQVGVGLAFLAPNILGFMAFTLIPLVFSLALAFTNWDLRYHNQFQFEPLRFVGLENIWRLLGDPRFWRYLGNTFFLMMGIPVAMAGSLIAALLLNHKLPGRRPWLGLMVAGTVLSVALVILTVSGMIGASLLVLILGIGGLLFFGGIGPNGTLYRVVFYTPHFTAGVATYVLWKKLYAPTNGPVNGLLEGPLQSLSALLQSLPPGANLVGMGLAMAALAFLLALATLFLLRRWKDADFGTASVVLGFLFLLVPLVAVALSAPVSWAVIPGAIVMAASLAAFIHGFATGNRFSPCPSWKGGGTAAFASLAFLVLGLICVGLGQVLFNLPAQAHAGLTPPEWLASYAWAKPSLMIMAFWAAVGSNNMILYLAGLSNVPPELEEAAKIDGAGAWQKFWNVTWPQLAPVTFFIFIMSVIHGLQGGFEMARVMTKGGPAGSTTTLSYYIYSEGFETGRLGYASALAWVLFLIVLAVTLINWRFGSRYTND